MKIKSFSKIALLLVLCLTVLCAVGIAASADGEETPIAKIDTANVAYNDMLHIAFGIEVLGTLPEGAELGIIAWEADVVEFNVATAFYATFNANTKDGQTYYKTRGIAARDMDTPIFVAPCVRDSKGAITVIGEQLKYSVLQYAGSRLASANVSAKQAKLYEDLIAYGMSSDNVLNGEKNYAFVKTINGTVGSAGATIGGWAGKEVLLRAEAKNADGEYFIKWVDANGDEVSKNRLHYVTVTEAGIAEYTAIFGAKADSTYANTYNFEKYVADELVKDSSLENGYIKPSAAYHRYCITESLSGDKQLLLDRLATANVDGYQAKFYSSSYQSNGVELDLEFTEEIIAGTHNNITLKLKDANGKFATVRLNLTYASTDNEKKFNFYVEGTGNPTVNDDNGTRVYIDACEGSTVTLKFLVDYDNIREVPVEVTTYKKDADGNYLDADGNITKDSSKYVVVSTATYTTYTSDLLIYANDKCLGKIDLMKADKYGEYFQKMATSFNANGKPSFILSDACTVSEIGFYALSTARRDVSLDNVMFFGIED